MQKMKVALLSGLAVVSTAVAASAAPIMDFTGVGTKVTEELTPAITAALPIAGLILAAGIAWKLYKKFTS